MQKHGQTSSCFLWRGCDTDEADAAMIRTTYHSSTKSPRRGLTKLRTCIVTDMYIENQLHYGCNNEILLETSRCCLVRRILLFARTSGKTHTNIRRQDPSWMAHPKSCCGHCACELNYHIQLSIPAAKTRSEGPQWKPAVFSDYLR